MTSSASVAVLVGSLRKASFSRRAAIALSSLSPPHLHLQIVEIGQLPLYDQDADDEKRPPAAWQSFREKIAAAEAILFVTPEYNRSVPGPLKNAIDIGSRPYEHSVWEGKPAAVLSISPGSMGAFGANHHLRQTLAFLNMPLLNQPEAYVGGAGHLFADDGSLKSDDTRLFFSMFMLGFSRWIDLIASGRKVVSEPVLRKAG